MAEGGETPEVNGTLLAIVMLFIPGILCYGIVAALGEKKERDNTTKLLQIFMYGVFSYVGLAFADRRFPGIFPRVDAASALHPADIAKLSIDPTIIGWAALFGIILGLAVSVNLNTQVLLRLCRLVRLTNRFGDTDVWTLLLNSTDTDDYVTIRRRDENLVYQGYVSGFSGGGETRELLIINVNVFAEPELAESSIPVSSATLDENPPGEIEPVLAVNSGLQKVGEIPFLYLSFEDHDVTLEFGRSPDRRDPGGRRRWLRGQ